MIAEWREEMATGDEEIDSQHRELLRRINDLLQGVRALGSAGSGAPVLC